jgi:hypothetical protein
MSLAQKHKENLVQLSKSYDKGLETANQLEVRRKIQIQKLEMFGASAAAEVYRFLSEGGDFKQIIETDPRFAEIFLLLINPRCPTEFVSELVRNFDGGILSNQMLLGMWESVSNTGASYDLAELLRDNPSP